MGLAFSQPGGSRNFSKVGHLYQESTTTLVLKIQFYLNTAPLIDLQVICRSLRFLLSARYSESCLTLFPSPVAPATTIATVTQLQRPRSASLFRRVRLQTASGDAQIKILFLIQKCESWFTSLPVSSEVITRLYPPEAW